MTRENVLALCCRLPGVTVHERYVATTRSGEEQSVAAGSAGGDLLEAPYLTNISCGSKAGLTQVGFSPPPADNRVSRVGYTAYQAPTGSPPESYLADLFKEYGEPKAQLGPDTIDRSRRSFAREYKWLFPRNAKDRDCAPAVHERDRSFFGAVPPDHRPCATQLTVRIVSDPSSVISANFKLFNAHGLDEAHDRHVAALNKRHGTHFEDTKALYARADEEQRQAESEQRQADAAEKQQQEAEYKAEHPQEAQKQADDEMLLKAFAARLAWSPDPKCVAACEKERDSRRLATCGTVSNNLGFNPSADDPETGRWNACASSVNGAWRSVCMQRCPTVKENAPRRVK